MHLHIISFDIPFPANYGGVIDVYYKLVWLHKLGVKIHLHCFEYGREHSKELEKVCEKVFYYDRKTHLASLLSLMPYTVQSRISKKLRKRLLKDDSPISFSLENMKNGIYFMELKMEGFQTQFQKLIVQ